MITIEMIDEFRKRTNSSYADAKYFLEKSQGDILEAIIDFESTKAGKTQNYQQKNVKNDFGKRFGEILQKSFDTRVTVADKTSTLFSIPVIMFVFLIPVWIFVLLIFVFLYILGYRFDIQYSKNESANINSLFQNINGKMKESRVNKEGYSDQKQKNADNSRQNNSLVPSDKAPAEQVQTEQQAWENEEDDGYKEYTVE